MIPECFGVIDISKNHVNFESTSCNIGKSLKLRCFDNRVGIKMLIIIKRNGEPDICERTKLLKDFFINDLGFCPENQMFTISEDEANKYEAYLSQSKVFKRYDKQVQRKLKEFANRVFNDQSSSQRQLLTVILNESDQEDIKDFVINRNPELGLNILHPKSKLPVYDKDKWECDEIVRIYV